MTVSSKLLAGFGLVIATLLLPGLFAADRLSELQNLATFLMADGCEWLSGETIALDGAGYLATGAYFTELDKMSDADWQKARELIEAQNEKDRAGRSA